jgi:hypothetical protein
MKSRIYKNQKTKDLAPVSGPNAFTGIWTSSVGGRFSLFAPAGQAGIL